MKKYLIATISLVVGAIIFAVCVSGKFHQGFEYEHKSISSLIEDENVKINPEHIFSYDYFSEGIADYKKYIDNLEKNSTDVFIVKATDNIDIKENVKQEVIVETVIKGDAKVGDTVDIIYYGYFTTSGNTEYIGLYNQNFMQLDKNYIVYVNQYEAIDNWYITHNGMLQSYFCMDSENTYGILDSDEKYGVYAQYEFFVETAKTGEALVEIKNYLFNIINGEQ